MNKEKRKDKNKTYIKIIKVYFVILFFAIVILPGANEYYKRTHRSRNNHIVSLTEKIEYIYDQIQYEFSEDKTKIKDSSIVYSTIDGKSCGIKPDFISYYGYIDFIAKVDKNGKIIEFYACDKEEEFVYTGDGLKLEDIGKKYTTRLISDNNFEISVNLSCDTSVVPSIPMYNNTKIIWDNYKDYTKEYKKFNNNISKIYSYALEQWKVDYKPVVYSYIDGNNCGYNFELDESINLDYIIKLDSKGKVREYYAKDEIFSYSYENYYNKTELNIVSNLNISCINSNPYKGKREIKVLNGYE